MKKLLMATLALALMTGCSSETSKPAQTEKPQAKPAELVSGRPAFQKLLRCRPRLGPGRPTLPTGIVPHSRL